MGAYVSPLKGGITTLETPVGRKFALNMHYYPWAGSFPRLTENADVENGRLPIDSWDCGISNAQILAGNADMLITTRALSFKEFGHPVFLRFMWDMNLPNTTALPYSGQARTQCYDPATDNADGTFSAKEYVAAYQHIRQIFAQNGVTNIIWLWSVSASGADPSPYYPGDSQVDWVGVDTYDPTGTLTFSSLFAPTYASLASHNKPIMVTETGTIHSNQQNFLTGLPAALQSNFPMVQGFVYFDDSTWALTPAAAATFAQVAHDPYLSGYGTP